MLALCLVAAAAAIGLNAAAAPLAGAAGRSAATTTRPTEASAGTSAGAAATRASAGTAAFRLVSQSSTVHPTSPGGAAKFTVAVAAPAADAADEVVTTLYTRLSTRSNFEQTLTHAPPSGTTLDGTHPVALSAMPADGGGRQLSITVVPDAATPAPAGGAPTLDLKCTPATLSTCTGVYPLVVSLVRGSGGSTTPVPHARFTTYLTYAATTSQHRLQFTWVVPVSSPVHIRTRQRDAGKALATPSPAAAKSLAGLVASLDAHPAVPVTVAASPQTLQGLDRLRNRDGGAQTVQALAAMSSGDPSTRQFLAQPYVPIDLGALAGAGETGEITAQMTEGAAVLKTLKIQTTGSSRTWVATGTVGSDLRTGLDTAGVDASTVVLPDTDLAPSTATSGTWASAFSLSVGKGAPLTAAASDSELAAHFTAHPGDPVLEANQLLADLAMIHFERPNTPTPRAVVAVPPKGWQPTGAFDTALLAGLTTNPVVQATTLGGFFSTFAQVPAATLPTRRLSNGGTGTPLAASLARSFTAQRLRLTSFDTAVQGTRSVLALLDRLLLAAESDDLAGTDQAGGVRAFERAFRAQLSLVQLATARTITLTARSGFIPVTMVSTAPYTVVGTLTLSGGRFIFPDGSTQHLRLDHSTTPVRIDVEARTSGDLPLEVTFDAPDGRLVIARGQLTVRSTATSLVGVVLTVLALLVLLGWWARTWRRGRRRRRSQPRPAGGA